MSGKEIKTKVQEQLKNQPGKVANFCYKVFMSIMVSLCLFGIKTGGKEVKDIVMEPIAKFGQLQVDRDSDKIEHLWIAQTLHKQDSINHSITDTLTQHSADISELFTTVAGLDLRVDHKQDR